jgi:hypothetical protein
MMREKKIMREKIHKKKGGRTVKKKYEMILFQRWWYNRERHCYVGTYSYLFSVSVCLLF